MTHVLSFSFILEIFLDLIIGCKGETLTSDVNFFRISHSWRILTPSITFAPEMAFRMF